MSMDQFEDESGADFGLTRRIAVLGIIGGLIGQVVHAATPPVYQVNGLALGGTDPTGYFRHKKPVKGSDQFEASWSGAVWRFETAQARAVFEADPVSFAPAYGGYCAYAVSRGYTASTDARAWHIHQGRLFLNYSRAVRTLWRADIAGNVRKADANWPSVLSA